MAFERRRSLTHINYSLIEEVIVDDSSSERLD